MDLKDEKIPAANIEPEKETASEPVKKRKPRAAKHSTPKAEKVDAAGFARQMVGIHSIIAAMTGNPIWNINDSEAGQLAASIEGIAAQYDLEVNPKVAAMLNFAFVATTIYGPRIYLMREMAKQAQPVKQQNDNVPRETIETPQPEAHPLFNNDERPQPVPSAAFDIAGGLDEEWPE